MQLDLVAEPGGLWPDQGAECRRDLGAEQPPAAGLPAKHAREDIAQFIHRLKFRPQTPSIPARSRSSRVERARLRPR